MLGSRRKVDKTFLYGVLLLVGVGVLIFVSASLSVLAKDQKLFYSILFNQLVLGLGLGLLGMYITLRVNYRFWKKYAFFIFLGALFLTLAVFIPSLGLSHGGAQRWLSIGPISLQPVEFLKFAFVIYFATWLSWKKNKIRKFKWSILPFFIIVAITGAILLNQPDTKNLILIILAGTGMLFLAGASKRQLFGSGLLILLCLGTLVFFTPYLKSRVETYLDPSVDQSDSSYQIKQSLIAIGSGGIFGRGYGQSVQKFTYLPEAQGDSIFAVLGEELGFVGSLFVVFLYVFFVLRGFRIASRAPDVFSRLLVSGIVILIGAQAFLHIAAIIGVFPLTGVPLPFMSHGGTSLMIYLASVGIILQISKYKNQS